MMRLGLILVPVAVALAGTPEGKAALEEGDYGKARREFEAAAKEGDHEAQFHLGEMYRRGLGVKASPPLALKWYRAAAEGEHAGAIGELGILKWNEGDEEGCRTLLQRSAGAGYARAQYALAYCFVSQPMVERAEWYRKAAEQGHADAQKRCADMLKEGIAGGKPDLEAAEAWYRKAAEQGHPEAFACIARLLLDRKEHGEAIEWHRKAALHGNFLSQHLLALAQLKLGYYAESWAWAKVGSTPRLCWPPSGDIETKLYAGYADSLKDTLKKARRYTKADQAREGEKLFKEYKKQIEEALEKGLPWEPVD